jgi:hypothetical protein
MITVAQYRSFARDCREMAARTDKDSDRRALELMASGWDKVANEREALIKMPAALPKPAHE